MGYPPHVNRHFRFSSPSQVGGSPRTFVCPRCPPRKKKDTTTSVSTLDISQTDLFVEMGIYVNGGTSRWVLKRRICLYTARYNMSGGDYHLSRFVLRFARLVRKQTSGRYVSSRCTYVDLFLCIYSWCSFYTRCGWGCVYILVKGVRQAGGLLTGEVHGRFI